MCWVSKYWVEGRSGCPIGGPFDLWRQNYFLAHGEPPEDTANMYPGLTTETVKAVAIATVSKSASLDEVLTDFGDEGPDEQLAMAHTYFMEWRKNVPFMPDNMQHIRRRNVGTEPEALGDFLEDWGRVMDADKPIE